MICCEQLEDELNRKCEQHQNNCPNSPFTYSPKVREWSIKLGDYWEYNGPNTAYTVLNFRYCPFCGYKFPESLRDKYFDALEALGIDSWMEPEKVPEEYKSDKWWNK